MKPLILVDGSSYFFRAFHALPPLTNSKGQPVGAILGVANMIRRLIKDYSPTWMAVVFDTPGPTFREALYPAYKAHRPPTPPDLSAQFDPLVTLLRLMGLPVLMFDGVEADDVIGTLATEAAKRGESVVISTGDKDFAQLVTEQITLLNTMSQQQLDIAGVKEKFDVWPYQIVDYLALMGDAVDNVPGVPKCGPKTAAKWLQQHETLEQVMLHADDVTGKIGEALRSSLPALPLSKQLVTIKTDVALPVHFHDMSIQPPDLTALHAILKELEFKTWLKEFSEGQVSDASQAATPPTKKAHYTAIQSTAEWQAYLARLKQAELICLDTETTSLDPLDANLVGLSFSIQPHEAVYVPLAHVEASEQLPKQQVLADLKALLEDPAHLKVGQNLKYDYAILKNEGIHLQGVAFDTLLESYLLNSAVPRHDMDTLAKTHLGYEPQSYAAVTKQGSKTLRFDEVSIEAATFYSAEDADVTLQLHQTLYPKLSDGQQWVLANIEMPLVPVLAEMEYRGVLIDAAVLKAQGLVLKSRLKALEEEAYQLAGHPFNIQSPLQLQTIFFEELGLPVISKTPKGKPSTAESVLQELAYGYRLPAVVLEYRRLAKLVSTYIDALPKRIHPKTHRVHTSFNQAVTATGRLSSSEPNLQNIPVRSEEGRAIRQAFIAPEGACLLSADYSQIELRIMAHLSQDKRLQQAFLEGLDIHAATSAEIFGVPLDAVTSEQRRCAKAVNFGLIYGMSAFGLSKQLGISRAEAEGYVKTYFDRYPGVLAYMERTREQAHQQGYVETLFGRRLYLPEIQSQHFARRQAAERMAINAPMQGTAADLIKLAMIRMARWQEGEGKGIATMVLQVHDELLFEVKDEHLEAFTPVLRECMEQVVALSVPLLVSIGVGKNWEQAH